MLSKINIEDIKKIVKSENILTSKEECYCYATDASNFTKEYVIPDVIVFVETIKEVQELVLYANEHKIPIISRGAGTNMVGACVSTTGGIILNFSKMNKIIDFNPKNLTITVEPGVIVNDIKDLVDTKGLFFPPDPSNFRVSTIGGAIAQSSGGAYGFKYGTIKDYVLSLKVVTANGELINLGAGTIKDAVGYHLNQLIVGSEGTLAIIVEAKLKVIPKPETTGTILAYFNSLEDAISATDKVLTEHVFPCAIEFMDKNSITTVENFQHCGLDTNANCLILMKIDGGNATIKHQLEHTKNIFSHNGAISVTIPKTEAESECIWQARRSSFSAATRLAPDVVSDDLIVPRESLTKLLEKCEEVSKKYNIPICTVGHIGDGNIHPQMVLDMRNEIELQNCKSAKAELYQYAIELGGTISAEHGIGIEKMPYLDKVLDKKVIEYMRGIKKIFDPNNILNPNKVFKIEGE